MSTGAIGACYALATIAAMFAGLPIAYALGLVAFIFMWLFMPATAATMVAENVYSEISTITLMAIPLFILKGAAIGRSPTGRDLYLALNAWLGRIPGGLGIANVLACGIFAAMSGSSPATCSAIGAAGIPEMRQRGYSPGLASGIIAAGGTLGILLPPSVTMILYAVVAQQSLGKLFLAGIGPGLLLVALFAAWSMVAWRREFSTAKARFHSNGTSAPILTKINIPIRQRFALLPRVLPFVVLMLGVMVALYGGYATPSETAGFGAVLALIIVALAYRFWRVRDYEPILEAALRESSMILMIIAASALYVYTMSYLHISQTAAQVIVDMHLSPWTLFTAVMGFMVVLGFFLPPTSIILMTGPILLPPLRDAGFNLIWFGVVMMIVMEMGLIHPPVGLNLFVIRSIAPDIRLKDIIWGAVPFLLLMMAAILILIAVPDIVLWLPDRLIKSD